jgi:hypothetical protein
MTGMIIGNIFKENLKMAELLKFGNSKQDLRSNSTYSGCGALGCALALVLAKPALVA